MSFRGARTLIQKSLRSGPSLAGWGCALVFLFCGCEELHIKKPVMGPYYEPLNAYRSAGRLPEGFRRVAVLPLTDGQADVDMIAGQQALEPVLQTELLKLRRLELVWISPDTLRQWTGRKSWSADEKLPTEFLHKMREQVACDGVLFCRLTRFRAYPPLAVGWSLKLVDAKGGESIWAFDDIFDSAEAAVSNSARRYAQQHQPAGIDAEPPLILTSPARFGHYAAWAALNTLPER